MENYICKACGVEYQAQANPPDICRICSDDRQYILPEGQQWTTLTQIQALPYRNILRHQEPGLIGISTVPKFGIGQRALLLHTDSGNILWDCISYIDPETIAAIEVRGGLCAIAISHPHFYACMNQWSEAFGGVPIWLNEADAQWIMRLGKNIRFWTDRKQLAEDVTLIQCGGHFPGSSVLHWSRGAGGRGVLLTGDTIQVGEDQTSVNVMYSYPNHIAITEAETFHILSRLMPFTFDRLYGMFEGRVIHKNAKVIINKYLEHSACST